MDCVFVVMVGGMVLVEGGVPVCSHQSAKPLIPHMFVEHALSHVGTCR